MLKQLVREYNGASGITTVYGYDNSGNLTKKYLFNTFGATVTAGHIMACYPLNLVDEISYGYSTSQWGDLLTNINGTTISYNSIGNPTNWRGVSSLSWQGKKLTRHTSSIDDFTDFTYNADGIRTSKSRFDTVTSLRTTHNYTLDGANIIKETVSGEQSYTNYYLYDEKCSIVGLEYNGIPYYFQKNIQGDVIRICDMSGNTVVEYTYDAWGKVLSTTGSHASTVGQINPLFCQNNETQRSEEQYPAASKDQLTRRKDMMIQLNLLCGNPPQIQKLLLLTNT